MKYLSIVVGTVLFAASVLLFSFTPDPLSIAVLSAMVIVLALGFLLGIYPTIRFTIGLRRAQKTIREAAKIQSADTSLVVFRENDLFRQHDLDEAFNAYKDVILRQQQAGEVLRDISEFISEDFLSVHTWQGLMIQIPGIMTGLGILGTFIGLIAGISTISLTSVDATIESISLLVLGIRTAFYTSISGVILSILFNILYRLLWNNLLRVHSLFLELYHRQVVPPTDVQMRQEIHSGLRELFRRLDLLPQFPGYSPVNSHGMVSVRDGDDKLLMPQIVQAMREEQFIFYLQPVVTLRTRKIVGAEALVRWEHESLGLLTPGAFLPILENNAYITKLDLYLWEKVCRTLRSWLDEGVRPLPITLNISKADILAMDLPTIFSDLLKQFQLPPRLLELDIAVNAYTDEYTITPGVTSELRKMGLKVTLDNFNGDFLIFRDLKSIEADCLKLDLRFFPSDENNTILERCFSQARSLGIEISAVGIENAELLTKLESLGCSVGQGSYFYHPMPTDEFRSLTERPLR